MTVDEELVCFRGRCPFRQCIPSKPGKYGIKIWRKYEANTAYAWKMQVYTGKNPAVGRDVYQGAKVVKDLVKEIENSGRNVTCNKFLYHHPTFSRSAENEPYSSRNYSEEQTELPPQLTVAKGLEKASKIFGFQNDAMMIT